MKFNPITDDIYVLKTPFGEVTSAVTLLQTKEGLVLIDSGADDQTVREEILPALDELGAKKTDIRYLLCTHTHGDHIGGHHLLRQLYPKMRIVATQKQAVKLADPLAYNIRIRSVYPKYSAPPSYGLQGVAADIVMQDGDRIAGLQVVPAAGHDSDCVCWLDEASGTLITGDSLQGSGTDAQGIALYTDLRVYRETLERVASVGAERIVAGPDFRVSGEFAQGRASCAELVKRCYAVTEEYDRILRSLGKTDNISAAKELIRRTGGKMPQYLFLALYTVDAHFQYADSEK